MYTSDKLKKDSPLKFWNPQETSPEVQKGLSQEVLISSKHFWKNDKGTNGSVFVFFSTHVDYNYEQSSDHQFISMEMFFVIWFL